MSCDSSDAASFAAPSYAASYQGQPGAFSEDAAFDFVPANAPLMPCRTLEEAFDNVVRRTARSAVIPVENTLAGPIDDTYALLHSTPLVILDETVEPISHCLIAPEGTALSDIRHVLSHPIALAQCAGFLRARKEWTPVPAFDTAGAVEMVLAEGKPGTAAIGSARSAEVYGGQILLRDIQDHPENYTRFLLLALPTEPPPHPIRSFRGLKTSISFRVSESVRRESGVLRPFIDAGIPLTNVLSSPVAGAADESVYHLDFIGAAGAPEVDAVLARLEESALTFKVVGAYPLRVASIREVVRPAG